MIEVQKTAEIFKENMKVFWIRLEREVIRGCPHREDRGKNCLLGRMRLKMSGKIILDNIYEDS